MVTNGKDGEREGAQGGRGEGEERAYQITGCLLVQVPERRQLF
jgi:hypothetical protein